MAAVVACFLVLPLGMSSTALAEDNNKDVDTYRLLNLFGDVFERVRASYVEKPSDQEVIEAAITGMLRSLDPHSSYLNAKSFKEMQVQTRGEFGRLGDRGDDGERSGQGRLSDRRYTRLPRGYRARRFH